MYLGNSVLRITILGILCASSATAAEPDQMPAVSFGGFIRADYGSGDRYPEARGEDQLGVSKAAFAVTATHGSVKGVFVVGTERLTNGSSDADGNVDIKDAFLVFGAENEPGFSWSVGAQALLFGLKPNGYPGDRSLQPSIEYGGGGAFAVSNQAGPSLIGSYRLGDAISVRFGAFDLDADNATGTSPATDGSSLTDNWFVQVRAADLFGTGLYATTGIENLYVGGAVDDSQTVFAAGVGYRHGPFDASIELTRLDGEIVGLPSDEQYLVTEVAYDLKPQWKLYVDWAQADELGADTLRFGSHYEVMPHVTFSAEYSQDSFEGTGRSDADSIDLRVTLSY